MTTSRSRALARVPRWMIAVGDQALVAVVNLFLSIAITHVGGVATLGRFAIITTTLLLTMGINRMLVSDPWLASRLADHTPGPELRALTLTVAAGAAVIVGGVVAVSCRGDARWYIACAIAPLIIVQDFGRYAAFRRQAPILAFVSDGLILVVGMVTVLLCMILGSVHLSAILVAWLIGLGAGTLVVLPSLSGRVSFSGAVGWWTHVCRPLATKLTHDGLAFLIGVNGSLYLLAYLGTQSDVGLVRIVQTVFSPVALTITGLSMWLVPSLALRDSSAMRHLRRRATLILTTGSVPMIVAAVILGPWFVHLVFGETASPGRLALALAGLSTAAIAVSAPMLASIRVAGNYAPVAWTRTLAAALTLAGMAVVVSARSTNGYLGLIAIQNVLIAVTAFIIGSRRASDRRGATSGSSMPDASPGEASSSAAGPE